MKPGVVVADEMFPEGAGPYTDLEEVSLSHNLKQKAWSRQENIMVDGFNDFDDLFDDEDLQ
ncbi:unnamed protein product [Ixodes persulcatus]